MPPSEATGGLLDRILMHAEQHRAKIVGASLLLSALIAVTDWKVQTSASIGSLYLLTILMASVVISPRALGLYCALCAVGREVFSPYPWEPGYVIRLIMFWIAFFVGGMFVIELRRNRALIVENLRAIEREMSLRSQTEEQLRAIVETSPLGIVSIDAQGSIQLANVSAARLFGFESTRQLQGQEVGRFLPSLAGVLRPELRGRQLRAAMECRGRRNQGDEFFASVWFATYASGSTQLLAAVVWDESESLRNREVAGWDALMDTTRVLIGTMMHEIRNLSVEAREVYQRLESVSGVAGSGDFRLLGEVVRTMESIASSRLEAAVKEARTAVDLASVLEEIRILVGPALEESGITMEVRIQEELPAVQADHNGLLQVFLNLVRNSQRALEQVRDKRIEMAAAEKQGRVQVRFFNTGSGIEHPERLFRPFLPEAESAGLGLYVSQAVLRSFGGDLRHEPTSEGCSFVIDLFAAGSQS